VGAGETKSRATQPGRRFKRRRFELPEGGALVLLGDGSIEQADAAGTTIGKWAAGDPEWAAHAIRFGLLAYPKTVAPHGPGDPAPKTLAG